MLTLAISWPLSHHVRPRRAIDCPPPRRSLFAAERNIRPPVRSRDGHSLARRCRSVKHPIQIRRVTVNAIVLGSKVVLVDRHGSQLCRQRQLADLVGRLPASVRRAWQWRVATTRMKSRLATRCGNRDLTPWERRLQSLAASFRLRGRFPLFATRGRKRFECYSTHTWDDASRRLWQQGHNRIRRHSRAGWVRWAHTVANNHNKRKGGRYASQSYCHRQDDHGTD